MLYVVRFFPEMTVKSRPVRMRLVKALRRNLRIILQRLDEKISVVGNWDILEVDTGDLDQALESGVLDALLSTPGISVVRPVEKLPLPESIDEIAESVLLHYRGALAGKTFVVRCKRTGTHDYSSGDIERQVGGYLLHNSDAKGVDLINPEITVRVEIRHKVL